MPPVNFDCPVCGREHQETTTIDPATTLYALCDCGHFLRASSPSRERVVEVNAYEFQQSDAGDPVIPGDLERSGVEEYLEESGGSRYVTDNDVLLDDVHVETGSP